MGCRRAGDEMVQPERIEFHDQLSDRQYGRNDRATKEGRRRDPEGSRIPREREFCLGDGPRRKQSRIVGTEALGRKEQEGVGKRAVFSPCEIMKTKGWPP